MALELHNTLTNRKETFIPITPHKVGMYNCGPTVYNYAHVGNLRSYVFADILRRAFEANGYTVTQVVNITDVGELTVDESEDKMVRALKREGKPLTLEAMREVADFYTAAFLADLDALGIETPHQLPRAGDHIKEDIEMVQKLLDKGFAYQTSDGIYFDTSQFPEYGKLGNIDIEGQQAGARIAVNPEKRNPRDFTLWKFSTGPLGWDSPWGKSFPGWHIECSAMSKKYLGQPFDVHTGGVDHIPTHHNNEIAQSESAEGVPLAHYWLHNAHIIVNGGKMAKSAGNFITLKTLETEKVSPRSYRYWLLTGHYRTQMNFTLEAVEAAQTALFKLYHVFADLKGEAQADPKYTNQFLTFINDDLDTPKAVALMWELVKDKKVTDAVKRATLIEFDRVLGLGLSTFTHTAETDIPPEIETLAELREHARTEKDFAKADALRKEIEERGYTIKDTDEGAKIIPQ